MKDETIKVLLVEDEASLSMIIQQTLKNLGFDITIAPDGEEGLRLLPHVQPDVIVADIMMPNMDGMEMVRRLRKTDRKTPVLFLTARSSVSDVVEGFELGADDYLRKPFSMLELIVRIRALVKRSSNRSPKDQVPRTDEMLKSDLVRIGSYTLNPVTQILSHFLKTEELSHRESELLMMLAINANQVVSAKDILLNLWGDDNIYNGKSLQVFISRLRHRLAYDPDVKIANVRGIGYKLITAISRS